MEHNTIREQFNEDCKVINFNYEYPGYVGYEQYGIITALSEKELSDKYAEILKEYTPYIILDTSYGEARTEFRRNEKKHQWRTANTVDCFNYEDGEMECLHPELIGESVEDEFFRRIVCDTLHDAINQLSEPQKRRIVKYFFYKQSMRSIADEEHVYHAAVRKSIECGLQKIKKLLENGYPNDLSHWE